MDGNCGYSGIPQESQSNNGSRNYALRTLARLETRPLSSQNHRINGVYSCSKGKADQTRHQLSQGDYDRVWRRNKPVQSVGFGKEGCGGIKGCGIYRGKASRPNSDNLHRRTQDYVRFDHSPAWTARRATTTTPNASAIRAPRVRTGRSRTRASRPRDFIARNDNRTSRVYNWRFNKRNNSKDIGKAEQGDNHLQEIRRRDLRQGTKSSHGKDGTKHDGSKRRGRTCHSQGSSQPSGTRESVGESYQGGSQLSYQEPHLGYRSPSTKSPSRHQQVCVQAQKEPHRNYRQVEGQASGQGIQSDLRHRLPRHLCTSRQTRIDQNTPCNCSNFWIGDSSDGRCDGIFGRRLGGGNLHGTTGGIRDWEQGRFRLSTQEKHLWIETGAKGLESENSALPQVNWLRTTLLGSMRLRQQGEGNYSRNVGGRPPHFRQGHEQRQ